MSCVVVRDFEHARVTVPQRAAYSVEADCQRDEPVERLGERQPVAVAADRAKRLRILVYIVARLGLLETANRTKGLTARATKGNAFGQA